MTWWAIDIRPLAEQRDELGAWLVWQTGQAVEERDDGTLVAFTPDEQSAERLIHELTRRAHLPVETTSRSVESTDWSTEWRRGLEARRVGRLTLMPSWLVEAAEPDSFTVVLDPEMAFGSGEHGSTRAALTLLDQLLEPGDRVLDLGSGSGILSIAAVKLNARAAIGIEIDPEANAVALRNARRNQVAVKTEFLEGDAGALTPLLGPVDLLVSNILRTVNTSLLSPIFSALRPGGIAIFSGMEEPEGEEFRRSLSRSNFILLRETLDAGWWAVAAARPG